MKRIIKITWMLLPVMVVASIISCDEDAIKFSMVDVSSKITGFSSDQTGAGATLTINGSDLDKVVRIFLGNEVVPKRSFTDQSASSITFTVPLNVPLGTTDVLVVFEGSERASTSIEVVPLPAISGFTPYTVSTGELVTVMGTNFDIVTGVKIGSVDATIVSKTASVLKFTVPDGISTDKITLVSPPGNGTSSEDMISCNTSPSSIDCMEGLNLNSGFELGTGDDFTNWSKFNGGTLMTATTQPGEVFRGERALKVTRDGSLASGQWRIQLASDLVTTEVGASYTVHVRAKASVAGGSMRVSTNPSALYTADQNVPTTWTILSFTFDAANEPSTRVVLDMNGNNTVATTFFIDDVKLVKN